MLTAQSRWLLSRVAGTVTNVYVEDNWTVKEGQLLLTLDPRDFEVKVDQAQAKLDRAKQSVDELYAGVRGREARACRWCSRSSSRRKSITTAPSR